MDNIILGNRYQLRELIGVGGMAKVYKATDRLLQREVAIKVLKDQYEEDDEFVKKFSNEALSAARLSHVNIVSVYDIGEDLISGKKIHYIVMEYVNGETLKDLIDKNKNGLSNHDIVDYSIQIAQALSSAHQSNIIHRDIKPQNILMDKYGLLKVTDFGIARVSTNATITYTSSILGTVHYISPEQAKGKFVDEKSDLYSLGVVMYEMATGKVPFDADNSVGIAVMHIQDEAVEPKEINKNLSNRLNDIIMKLLEKNPQDRFTNAKELIRALEDENYNIGSIKKEQTAKIPVVEDNIEETSFIPIVEEKIPAEERNDEDKILEEKKEDKEDDEAIYVSPGDDNKNLKEKKKKRKIWPIFLVILALALGVFYYVRSSNSNMVEVPTVLNLSEDEAVKLLKSKNLKANVSRYAESNNYGEGKVMEQDPSPKAKVKPYSTVNLVISQGREVKVPDLSNMTVSQAEESLKEVGLSLGKTNSEYSDTVEKDKIISQNPRVGETVQSGSEIDINVSLGKKEPEVKNVSVPNLVGQTEEKAISIAENSSISVRNINYEYSESIEKGIVISQSISANTEVAENSKIDLVVSNGKDPSRKENTDNKSNEEEKDGKDKKKQQEAVNVSFSITPPKDKESFNIKIYKLSDDNQKTDLLYNQNHTSKEVGDDGTLSLNFKSVVGTRVQILVDGESKGVYEVNK
ncbi:Stk1 family PASTA domain-containing Ser/Thr kinase [Anaerococcus porci]|uniref:non-specific serine/threonine protein kinase n=1 Tax=Anaerococcus porci TaxID=2652269 RepID=A0A6N7VSW2_9FIRM|nr:Stk1 family PASTA domain-containing Ser/Thr kinase [Anaerococcus porci]MDY3006180.1 Stk1 family PASTA domain-containing Ser/Thr kinase [Anaerococcus porci]MSS77154.1 Stk1 family PASTA domain-containing Ser/Thr kinase [Anaerococcus porci]